MNLSERKGELILFGAALLLYVAGIAWGLPTGTGPEQIAPWGSDEIGGIGPLAELYSVFLNPERFNPQYPLFHYLVMGLFAAPYVAFLLLTGGLTNPTNVFPFGLSDPETALATLVVLTRAASLLMGAGVVVLSRRIVTTLWNPRAGWIAGVVVLLAFTMVFYSRTSNADMPGLFWTACGYLVFARVLRQGLSMRRAAYLGVFAALATATKDAYWTCFLSMALILLPVQLRAGISFKDATKPVLWGLAFAGVTYGFASGLFIRPERWLQHLDFLLGTSMRYVYPATLAGTLGLLTESALHVVASLGWVVTGVGVLGVWLALRAGRPAALALAFVVIPALVLLPVHFVMFRFVLPLTWLLALYAGIGFDALLGSRRPAVARSTVVVAILSLSWLLVRDLDLTWQMVRDARYEAGEWLTQHAAGEPLGYYGAVRKLPPLPGSTEFVPLYGNCTADQWANAPDVIFISPQQHFATIREWEISDEIWDAITSGRLGYELVWLSPNRGLFSRLPVPFVNPPIRIFMREAAAGSLPAGARQTEYQPALLENFEPALFPWTKPPRGLVTNPTPRAPAIRCDPGSLG